MARKGCSDEDALKILREIVVHLHDGLDVVSSCRKAEVSNKTYYHWRKKFGGIGHSQLFEIRALPKENDRLKKILTELQLDKLILKESLDYLKPKAWRLMGCVRP
jgi:putative transposase